jgi:hypothetical protein
MEQEYINNLKREYNKYLQRHVKAAAYLDDNNIAIAEREKWLPEYKNILSNLNRLLNTFDIYNVEYTAIEALGGFVVEEAMQKGA